LDDAIERVKINTRRLAKNQRTWFRRWRDVTWIDVGPEEQTENVATRLLEKL
jgi:tRNA dimethylallyltransferase